MAEVFPRQSPEAMIRRLIACISIIRFVQIKKECQQLMEVK